MGRLFAAYPTERPGDIISMVNLVRFPPIFTSGVFIPRASLPPIGQISTFFSPLTYGNDPIQGAYTGKTHFNPFIDVALLVVFIPVFYFVTNQLHKRFND